MDKVKQVCRSCGSDNVLADAYASWNFEIQKWEIENTFAKGGYCNTCDGECTVEEEVVDA